MAASAAPVAAATKSIPATARSRAISVATVAASALALAAARCGHRCSFRIAELDLPQHRLPRPRLQRRH
eukprot:1489498-Prymnesium_polylepis.1